ncbi:MAG: glycerophosphodiester phosphodiesterase [Nitrospiria bacterium]
MMKPIRNFSFHPLLIAHRGASAYAPENTMTAFETAVKMKANMIELDIQLTSDGHWVVMHDLSLKRTCGLRKKVRSVPLAQIKTLDAGSWFSPQFSGEKVPTLKELLTWAKNKVSLNLEIKGQIKKNSDAIPSLLKTLSEYGMKKNILLSSFDWKILRRIRACDKNVALGVLVSRQTPFRYLREALDLKAFSVNLPPHKLKKGVPQRIHSLNMAVFVYTLNSLFEIKKYLPIGIDGFFTNFPDLQLKINRSLSL